MGKATLKALVEGGKATPAPPLGPSLSEAKINVGEVIAAINEKTKDFAGMQVPVEITYDTVTKEFDIKVGTPPVSSLIKKELKVKKLSKAAWGTYTPKEGENYKEFVGDLKFDQIMKITKAKIDGMLTTDLKKAVKMVVSTCLSCGVTVEGKNPKEINKEIEEGKWDKNKIIPKN